MNNRRSQHRHPFIFVMVLALMFLFMITPASVAVTSYERQNGIEIAESHQILFDDDFDLLDCIHLDGEEYYIIKQKNFFLFANRLGIYRSDGRIVENYNLSKSIFEVYAWKRQTDKLKAMDRGDLRGVLTTSGNIGSAAVPLHRATGTVVSAIVEAKSVKIGDIYVWDTATKIKPELKSFENTVRSFDREVGEWDSASFGVNANLPDVIEGLESIDRGEEIDWTGFAYSTKASVGAFNKLSVKTGQISYRVSSVREKLKEVNRGLGSVGGGLLAGAFGELDGKLGSVQDSIDGYTGRLDQYSREFDEISRDVELMKLEMDREWKRSLEQGAVLKLIYYLLGFIFICFIIIIITLLTDFRERLKEGDVTIKDTIKYGILTLLGSSIFGILMIYAYMHYTLFQYGLSHNAYDYYFSNDLPNYENIYTPSAIWAANPFHSLPRSIEILHTLSIFLIYIAGLIILFSLIYGIVGRDYKISAIYRVWVANVGPLIGLYMWSGIWEEKPGEETVVFSVALTSLFLSSIIYACLCHFLAKPEISFNKEEGYGGWYVALLMMLLICMTGVTLLELHANIIFFIFIFIMSFLNYFITMFIPIMTCLMPWES